jgi:MSHA biogenesis protein MshL
VECVSFRALVCLLAAGVLPGAAAAQPPAPGPGQLPPLPLTQLDERALSADLDNRAFTLTFAQPVPINDLLLLLVRGTSLSVVPDPQIAGSFIGDLKNVTVRQALGLILPGLGLDYDVDGSFVRVFRRELDTRLFSVDYVATRRIGDSSAGGAPGSGFARVSSETGADVFADLSNGVRSLVSERGTFNLDRKAGLLQVTDLPERLDRVAAYLDAVNDRAQRRVKIDARVLEVELNEPNGALDWTALAEGAAPGSTGTTPPRSAPASLRIADLERFLAALDAQGTVISLAAPQLLALNNEPAVVRASRGPATGSGAAQDVTLGVTPQVSDDGLVTLSLTPIVVQQTADQPAATSRRETDILARVRDGETIVIAGLPRESESRERRNAGVGGGWFGRSTVVVRRRHELVILLTPRILTPLGAP